MKKISSPVALFFLLLMSPSLFGQSLGDVNVNSNIDIVDALLVAQYYVQ